MKWARTGDWKRATKTARGTQGGVRPARTRERGVSRRREWPSFRHSPGMKLRAEKQPSDFRTWGSSMTWFLWREGARVLFTPHLLTQPRMSLEYWNPNVLIGKELRVQLPKWSPTTPTHWLFPSPTMDVPHGPARGLRGPARTLWLADWFSGHPSW